MTFPQVTPGNAARDRQTLRHRDDRGGVATIHFASAMPRARCNDYKRKKGFRLKWRSYREAIGYSKDDGPKFRDLRHLRNKLSVVVVVMRVDIAHSIITEVVQCL